MRRLLIFTLLVLLLCSVASAVGRVSTVDIGYYNADEMKQAVQFKEKEWANGTYSNTRLEPGGVVTFDIRDHLTMSAAITLTPTNGAWKWYPANQTGNMVFYRNAVANVSYTTWDTILKEQIILAAPVSSISWQINLSVKPQALTVTVDGNDYLIKDPNNNDQWIRVKRPFVVDAKGVRRDLRYTWNNGQKRLTLVQDFSGLTYPLTIDPTYSVDTVGSVGLRPVMLINSSGFPMIVYGDKTNSRMKLAVNNSGAWSKIIMTDMFQNYFVFPLSATIDPTNDLPLAAHLSFISPRYQQNITYFNNGWKTIINGNTTSVGSLYTEQPGGAYKFASSRIAIPRFIGDGSGDSFYNITLINTNWQPFNYTINPIKAVYAATGGVNSSNLLNLISQSGTLAGVMNLSVVTDNLPPSITNIQISASPALNTTYPVDICAKINPTTDLPAYVYKPANSGSNTYNGSAINYSYMDGGKWVHETIYWNTSHGSRSALPTLAYNGSGVTHVAWIERDSEFELDPTISSTKASHVIYSIRTGAGTWTTPKEAIDASNHPNFFPPSITFDTSDNMHMAAMNGTGLDLIYYFEPLPSGGIAPVAAFSCTPLTTVRNGTITCTDSSTNTPTSWDWYSPDAQQQVLFSGNITNQNPSFFPHKLGGYFSVNLIATNSYGTSTKASGPRYIWVQKPLV